MGSRTHLWQHAAPASRVRFDPVSARQAAAVPRSATGSADLHIEATFEFDLHNPDHPFIGYANVEITSHRPEDHPHGLIATIEVYETVVAAIDNGTRDVVQERLADTMTLHFASSFLVADKEYFDDRDAGYAAMERTLGKINERYVRTKLNIGPIDPISQVSKQALVDKAVTQIAEAAVHERPDEMQVIEVRSQKSEVGSQKSEVRCAIADCEFRLAD